MSPQQKNFLPKSGNLLRIFFPCCAKVVEQNFRHFVEFSRQLFFSLFLQMSSSREIKMSRTTEKLKQRLRPPIFLALNFLSFLFTFLSSTVIFLLSLCLLSLVFLSFSLLLSLSLLTSLFLLSSPL